MPIYTGPRNQPVVLMYFGGAGAAPASITVSDGTVFTPVSPLFLQVTTSSGTTTQAVWAIPPKYSGDSAFLGFKFFQQDEYLLGVTTAIPAPRRYLDFVISKTPGD